MKKAMLLSLLAGASTLFADGISVTVNRIHQRWPWEAKIDIDFTLACPEGEKVDLNPEFYDGGRKLTVSSYALSGDVYGVSAGSRRLTLDPMQTAYTNQVFTRFSVSFSKAMPMPLYLIVDLTKSRGDAGQLTYLTESDLRSGAYGTVEENPVAGVSSLIWTGVTNDAAYATTKMVFRRVNPGTFTMGYGGARLGTTKIWPGAADDYGYEARLTRPYYIAVFPTTQSQWTALGFSNYSYFKTDGGRRPVERLGSVSGKEWEVLRGSDAADGGYHWPDDGYAKSATSWLGVLQDRLGLVCDLPTEAQWEYACRAGTATAYNDGIARTLKKDADFTGITSEIELLGRFSSNGGKNATDSDGPEKGTANVGSYRSNAWGLYDMHGNVYEACLDWGYPATTNRYGHCVANPSGPTGGSKHIGKGGSSNYGITHALSGFRWSWSRALQSGFRVVVFPEGVEPEVGEAYSEGVQN